MVSPCEGEVIAAVDEFADLHPPQSDKVNIAGNHVVVDCVGASVVLAHLQKDSVSVRVNDKVSAGQFIARAGNSGNTSEPHLHIHAVEGKYTSVKDLAGTAKGMPMIFDGKFLVRNDRVRAP